MKLPDFIIIGAAKAGTTSLYALLNRHPDVFMSDPKEPEFFARDDHYARGLSTYQALFGEAGPDQIIGEASTLYSHMPFFDQTAGRIHNHIPQVKIIYVLRHPVERAYSYYIQIIKNYQNGTKDYAVHRTFEEFILPDWHARAAPRNKVFADFNDHLPDTPELCLSGSDYLMQIHAYLKYFDRDQILFLSFEAFRCDRRVALRQITDFLGLDPLSDHAFDEASTTRNISRNHFDGVEGTMRVLALKDWFSRIWALKGLLPKGLRTVLRKRVAKGSGHASGPQPHAPAPMLPETRTLLEERFAAQIPELSGLTGLDLSHWGLER